MTHDELLAELDALNDSCSVVDQLVTTIRAVVDLHSPCTGSKHDDAIEFANVPCICVACDGYEYPCPTIKAIQEELA